MSITRGQRVVLPPTAPDRSGPPNRAPCTAPGTGWEQARSTHQGRSAHYLPDILIRIDTGEAEPLNLLVEVTGERRADKQVKVETARTLWVPAVNAHGGFGRWAFYEVTDPWNAEHDLRGHIRSLAGRA